MDGYHPMSHMDSRTPLQDCLSLRRSGRAEKMCNARSWILEIVAYAAEKCSTGNREPMRARGDFLRSRSLSAQHKPWDYLLHIGSTCKEPEGFFGRRESGGGFRCAGHRVSIYRHLERGSDSPSNASRDCSHVLVPCSSVATRRFINRRKFQCLCRILPCAWSTRQRTCFLPRRVSRAESSRETSVRCRAVRALHSRTGSSSFAIKDSGTSAFVDRQPTSSAIDRIRDDVRQRQRKIIFRPNCRQ